MALPFPCRDNVCVVKGGYQAGPQHKASSIVVDFITPETETSIWYFWGMARSFKPKDDELTASIREGQ
jgi:vanillate O-demethylase monooxygenase subunit